MKFEISDNTLSEDEKIYGVRRENRIIQFKSVFGIPQITINPRLDTRTRKMMGVKTLSPEEKLRVSYVVQDGTDKDQDVTSRTIGPGFYLDLSDIVDRIDWEWIQHSKGIALSYEDMLNDPTADFFVFDEEKEQRQGEELNDARADAINYVKSLSDNELSEKVRLLGDKLDNTHPRYIRNYLSEMAFSKDLTTVKRILGIKNDRDAANKLMIYQLVDKSIVKIVGEVYSFKEITLGVGLHQVVAYMKYPENAKVLSEMRKTLYPELYVNGQFIDPAKVHNDSSHFEDQLSTDFTKEETKKGKK
jgi:hypothetical protein